MKQWYIRIEDVCHKLKLTIYEDGKIYGNEKGSLLGILTADSLGEIKSIINPNMYMFKKLVYYKENLNKLILRVNDTSRKHRNIKVVGWSQMPKIIKIITDEKNFKKVF